MLDVGVVVLLFNRWPEAREVLDAVFRQTRQPSCVVVLDNASSSDPTARIRDGYPHATVLRAERNGGYAAGMNLAMQGMSKCRPDAYLLLTHDCLLADTALSELCDGLASDPSLGLVGPVLGYRNRPDQVFSGGGEINRKSWRVRHRRTPSDLAEWPVHGVRRVAWLDGSCLLVRQGVVEQIGMLDERYFLYFEDVDYCLRALRNNFGVGCVLGARAWQEPSDNLTPAIMARNRFLLMRSNGASKGTLARELALGAWRARPRTRAKSTVGFTEWVRCAAGGLRAPAKGPAATRELG